MNEHKTKVAAVDAVFPDQRILDEAERWLAQGFPVVFPTETVYGLGADAFSEEAVIRVYQMKGRAFDKPLAVMIADEVMLTRVAKNISSKARRLIKEFWPGPLTIVMQAQPVVSLVSREGTVGVRFPDHAVPLNLIRTFGRPIAATSANAAGKPSPVRAGEALSAFDGKVPLVLDGGICKNARESTILDCTGDTVKILRIGALPMEDIERVLGEKLC